MSMPNIPDINPAISINRDDVLNILIASIGLEELALAHILNAEGEKIQYVLGTLQQGTPSPQSVTINDVLDINKSVIKTMREVIKTEILLQTKLENAVELLANPQPLRSLNITYLPGTRGIGTAFVVANIAPATLYTIKAADEVAITFDATDVFAGWRAPDGTIYSPGATITINQDETLTAVVQGE